VKGKLMENLFKSQAGLKGINLKKCFWKIFFEIQGGRIPANLAFEANLDRRGRERKFKG